MSCEHLIPGPKLELQVLKSLFAFLNAILIRQMEIFSIEDSKQYQDDKESA